MKVMDMRSVLFPIALLASPGIGYAQSAAHPSEASSCDAFAAATKAAPAVPATAIGLPSRGAVVTSAQSVSATADHRAFCMVKGQIDAANPADPTILFELNLPAAWNGKAVQMGGAGFNGAVVDGLGRSPGQAVGEAVPLAQGYATYGSDSGHQSGGFDGRFGLNAQALANYSGESVKRLHDAASYLIRRYYHRPARRTYYAGGSKGGQEGLVAAQRYGADYDGIVAFYPAAQNQAMVTAWYNMWTAAYARPGAALSPAKQALLTKAVLEACDGLDGVVDGVVANTQACTSTFAVNRLRCPGGGDQGDGCLSDAQIDTLQLAATPYRFPFPLAHGVTQIGPFPVYMGADLNGMIFGRDGGDGNTAMYHAFFEQVVPYFVLGKADASASDFSVRDHQARMQQISAIFDVSNPDIDRFRARGGKLIIVQGTTDMLVPETMTTAYVETLRQRYGENLRGFVRYYLQPGYGHGLGAFQLGWDALKAVDEWVETGRAPVHPVARDRNSATAGRTMPLCEQPRYPRYLGTGSPREERNYTCALPEEPLVTLKGAGQPAARTQAGKRS